jgi:hypothetical protein
MVPQRAVSDFKVKVYATITTSKTLETKVTVQTRLALSSTLIGWS